MHVDISIELFKYILKTKYITNFDTEKKVTAIFFFF